MNLELLLTPADTDRPALDGGLSADSALGMDRPDPVEKNLPQRDDGADPNALSRQGWAVIAPEGPEGDALIEAVAPLIEARRAALGRGEVPIERVPRGMTRAVAAAWKLRTYGLKPPEEQPRYLLLLGDLGRVSLELQQALATDFYVGRLAFGSAAAYAAYAAKVLRWERAPTAVEPRALLFTVRDRTPATEVGHQALMRPSFDLCRRQREGGSFAASEVLEIPGEMDVAREALLGWTGRPEPAVLFSMSHGRGPPSTGTWTAEEQREQQGALCLGRQAYITAADVATGPFLPGGIWFFYACFGAATPKESVYYPWLHALATAGRVRLPPERVLGWLPQGDASPFVAALPQAALANPEGPLAVIGHADLAWTSAFLDPGPGEVSHPARFYAVLRALAGGCRAGVAHAELMRFLVETTIDLLGYYDDQRHAEAWHRVPAADPGREARKAEMWMRRHDLGGYILLGDPAVRLPLARYAAEEAIVPALGVAPEVEVMERAVLAALGDGEAIEGVAGRYGVAAGELRLWAEGYREAGRAVLERMRAKRGGGAG